jgi:hypothetical protein
VRVDEGVGLGRRGRVGLGDGVGERVGLGVGDGRADGLGDRTAAAERVVAGVGLGVGLAVGLAEGLAVDAASSDPDEHDTASSAARARPPPYRMCTSPLWHGNDEGPGELPGPSR